MNPWKMAGSTAAAAAAIILGIQAYASSAALGHADRLFMEAATRAGLFELRSGDLALQRASRDEVRTYAQAVMRDHAEARARLMALAAAKSRAVPGAIGAEQHAVLGELQQVPSGAFDALYLEKVAVDGQAAVLALFKQAVRDSKDPEIQAYAASVVPMLQQHLHQARLLQAAQWPETARAAGHAG
ncbi:DUF4142 domain-containing protein [Bordetella sp. BOR01]|uniref:DUF4142 domain-containing protein n=1 Tax=Bordetella sp. BOR01 TaxID=2854779 RepID=UPI001C4559D5|nr:DUF4142 domain-containing protein [Bordetella sp. BOR01]MBV7486143.1 DUF4142 domain-containing protein [Bordetella sp. BOR01]